MIQLTGSTGSNAVTSNIVINTDGKKRWRWRLPSFILKIPVSIRRWILFPLLCFIGLFAAAMGIRLGWRYAERINLKVTAYAGVTILGLISMWFLIKWLRGRTFSLPKLKFPRISLPKWTFLKRSLPKLTLFRIILFIGLLMGWLFWKIASYIHGRLRLETPIAHNILYAIFILLPLCGAWFVWRMYQRKYPAASVTGTWIERRKKKWYWREEELSILIGIIALHLDIYTVWPEWWMHHIYIDRRIWWLHGILVAFAWLIPKGTIKYHHKLGKMGVWLAALSMVYIFIGGPNWQWASGTKSKAQTTTMFANISVSHPIPPHRVEDEEPEVAKLAREKLANQPDLLERCTEESGLRQHKKVGDTFDTKQVLRGLNADGTEGPAVGVCQINEVANGAFCKAGAFDIFTIEGNLNCALALYARDGLAPWYTDPRSPSILPFDATIGSDWTVLKIDGRHFDYHIDKATGTELMANGNPVVIDNPANLVLPGIIKTFAIRSTMGGTHAHIIETTRP